MSCAAADATHQARRNASEPKTDINVNLNSIGSLLFSILRRQNLSLSDGRMIIIF
jgi:hypothetical protein